MEHVKKWYTMNEYVDGDTGELISKKKAERDYIIINKTKKIKIENGSGYITYTNKCERNRQQRIW